MNERVLVFGFGSFFRSSADPKDIDLLLLHESADPASCQFAIACKAHLQRALPAADIVMLSQTEEEGNQFLARSQAVEVGTLSAGDVAAQTEVLVRRILGAV